LYIVNRRLGAICVPQLSLLLAVSYLLPPTRCDTQSAQRESVLRTPHLYL
jgi:hypothetical protein